MDKAPITDIDSDMRNRLPRRLEENEITGFDARTTDLLPRVALIDRLARELNMEMTINIENETGAIQSVSSCATVLVWSSEKSFGVLNDFLPFRVLWLRVPWGGDVLRRAGARGE